MKVVNINDVLNILHKYGEFLFVTDHLRYMEMRNEIANLPNVTPQPKMGRWKAFTHSAYHGNDEDGEPIWREVTVYHCKLCNRRTVIKENYCPNCGAKMVEPQEGSGEE